MEHGVLKWFRREPKVAPIDGRATSRSASHGRVLVDDVLAGGRFPHHRQQGPGARPAHGGHSPAAEGVEIQGIKVVAVASGCGRSDGLVSLPAAR